MPRPDERGSSREREDLTAGLWALRQQQEESLAVIDALLRKALPEEPAENNLLVKEVQIDQADEESSKEGNGKSLKKVKTGFLSGEGSQFRELMDDGKTLDIESKTWGDRCRWLVSKPQFDWFMGFIIFLNSICIGIDTQHNIDISQSPFPNWPGEAIDLVFICAYFVEIGIRLTAWGRANFKDGWFLFDLMLVAMGFVGNIVEPILTSSNGGENGFAQILVVRSLRLLRLVRAIRMLHMFRTVWRLVYGLLTSGNAMLSTFFILVLTLYIFACLGVEFVTKDPLLATHPLTADIVDYNFSSLQRTMLTLISFIHADSIKEVYEPIIIVRPAMIIFFVSVILTVSVSLMNLVTAVLVEGALQNAANDKELSRHDLRLKVKKFAPKIMEVFVEIDKDGSGTIDRDELSQIKLSELPFELSTEHVSSLEDLFDMLDVDGKGTLTSTEFADGLLQLLTMDMPIHTMKTFKLLHLHGTLLHDIDGKLQHLQKALTMHAMSAIPRSSLTS
ncbi:Voltage-dependent calcium channel type A subunit alpha-1 (Cacophony protein) [Durusdinium trenchii]|uniref:Voltage-dependent calcium channel type A subunit alpha-1 (Cacophony protein) n=1 Tax=Durusdinium trenchii TaxID=1381693 RepID=A0ABP0QPT1_9DINO